MSKPLEVIKRRADFLAVARGERAHCQGFVLQARLRPPGGSDAMRIGYTCSKKVGNAVARNRAKRRLREIARRVLPRHGRSRHDYVLIGRAEKTASADFQTMCEDLASALSKVHGSQGRRNA